MGFCRDDFGAVSIESRRESFYIHACTSRFCNGSECEGHVLFPRDTEEKQFPHPEFTYVALDSLITALVDLRDNDHQYRKWREGRGK